MPLDLQLVHTCLEASTRAYSQDTPNAINSKLAHAIVLDSVSPSPCLPLSPSSPAPARVIAFRGSQNLRDWLTDGQALLSPIENRKSQFENASVHLGFFTAYQSIADKIHQAAAAKDGDPIILTGHSLGGALAVLAAWHLARHFIPVTAIITFGQPRLGDPLFASDCQHLFGEKHLRVINDLDLVPRLPGLLAGYRHSGQRLFIGQTTRPSLNPWPWRILSSDLRSLYHAWRAHDYFETLEDHSLKSYASALSVAAADTVNAYA